LEYCKHEACQIEVFRQLIVFADVVW